MAKRPGDPGQAAGWCIHYTAPPRIKLGGGEAPHICAAGVNLGETFKGTKFAVRPCFLDQVTGESQPDALPCQHLRRPTPEEIALHEAWADQRLDLLRTVMTGIRPWRDAHKGRSASEVVECPACKGRLHLSIAASNGHVHGRCETTGCARWME